MGPYLDLTPAESFILIVATLSFGFLDVLPIVSWEVEFAFIESTADESAVISGAVCTSFLQLIVKSPRRRAKEIIAFI